MNAALRVFLEALIYAIHIVVDAFLELVLGFILGPRKSCPPPENKEQEQIVTKSAVELAALIREQKLTSYEVVKAYYERILAINPAINAVVDGPVAEALEEARVVDEKLQNNGYSADELAAQPFLGVPFTTKDSTSVAGRLHTLGLLARRNERSKEDAECVRLMKQSGAIIIATSNIPEVNMWIECRNRLIGTTNNPYDLRRSVGGSSGGEAALITACGTAFGLGTDIGGSIRIPAFNCGVFGHKPSENVVNLRGCTYRTGTEKKTMCAAGPMSRYATDLKPILSVIAEPTILPSLKLNEGVDIKKLRYFYIPCNHMIAATPVNNEAHLVMQKVRRHFSNLTGTSVQVAKLPGIEVSGKLWHYWMTQEATDFRKYFGNGVEPNAIVELVKKLIGQSDFTMAAIYSMVNKLLPKGDEQALRQVTSQCKEALRELLGDDGVLFYHSQPRTTPFHYYPLFKFADYHYFSIFNVLKTPVTQVPMGLDSKGLPLGIQVVSSDMNDRLCLAVAEELQRSFGGWVPPFIENPINNDKHSLFCKT